MRVLSYFVLACCTLFLFACRGNGGNKAGESTTKNGSSSTSNSSNSSSSTPSSTASFQKTPSGLSYDIHTKSSGPKANFGDFLTLHMQYTKMNDSIIFSSFNKDKPLSFKLQKTLFKGVLNDGLSKMAAGDSATFLVVADSLYGTRLPRFLKTGEQIKYTIKLDKIQSRDQYQSERDASRKAQLTKDNKVIREYTGKNDLKTETSSTGLQYVLAKAGTEDLNTAVPSVLAKYKLSVLPDGTEIENTNGEFAELKVQMQGIRESLALLKKGGSGTFIIPSVLAYGDRKRGDIPPNSTLVYEIEDVKQKEKDNTKDKAGK